MTTFPTRITDTSAGRPPRTAGARRASAWAFAGVAVTSFGGPLALAALYAPGIVAGSAGASAGLAMVAAVAVFAFPLAIWLRYARQVNGPGGLYSFVEAAAGRRVALVQAGLWIVSYLLYLLYTTAQVVYDTLPAVLPGERRYQPVLEIAIPVALAGVMIAGRRITLLVTGLVAAGQLAIAAALGGVTLTHLATPVSSFGASAPARALATATGQTALLYICGSLPLFLGGELARPARTIRRGLTATYLVTAAVIIAAVAPLAADPAITRAPIPGMAVAERFAGHGFAVAVGVGVAVSVAGVMLVEYLALSRLIGAVTSWPLRWVIIAIGAAIVVAAPFTLINPERIYTDLLTPSLVALCLSQLMVFAVYPRFAARQHDRPLPAVPHPGHREHRPRARPCRFPPACAAGGRRGPARRHRRRAAAQRRHRPVRLDRKPGGAVRRDVPGRGVHGRGGAHGCRGDRPGRLARNPALARAILLSSPPV